MLNWEEIKHENDFHLIRARVFGGWLVIAECDTLTGIQRGSYIEQEKGHQFRQTMTFVPDPNHEWNIK